MYLALAALAALAFGCLPASAFDAAKFPSPTFNAPKVDKLEIQGPGSTGDVSGMSVTLPEFGTMTLPNAFAHKKSATRISAPPASLGNWASILTAFDGDLSKVNLATRHWVEGATTAGAPTTGYRLNPELSSIAQSTYIAPEAGHNQATATNDGRTGIAVNASNLQHYGNGDAYAQFSSTFVVGAKTGATHFLANPAATLLGGQTSAGANGVFLQGIGDINLVDNGYDVAGGALTLNLLRTNDTGNLQTDWFAYRAQSIGTKPIGAFFVGVGPAKVGLDLTKVTFGTDKIGIALPQGARIYGNATNADPTSFSRHTSGGLDWIERGASSWVFVYNNYPTLQIDDNQVTAAKPLVAYGGVYEPTARTIATATTACVTGEHAWDANYEYRCVATNTWKRAALSPW